MVRCETVRAGGAHRRAPFFVPAPLRRTGVFGAPSDVLHIYTILCMIMHSPGPAADAADSGARGV